MAPDPVTELIVWGALALALYLSVADTSAIAVRLAGTGALPALVNRLARLRSWPRKPGIASSRRGPWARGPDSSKPRSY